MTRAGPRPRRWVLALLAALAPCAAWAQQPLAVTPPGLVLQSSRLLAPAPSGDQAAQRPMILRADELQVRPELDAAARGDVEFRRAGMVIRADRFSYDSAEDLAKAGGGVVVTREGARYSGSELQLKVQRFEGFFLQPTFEFTRLGAGGRAERIDFLDSSRLRAEKAIYTSCPREGGGEPDWLLRTDRIKLDFGINEGTAEGAVLEFLGVPILALPVLTFPLTDDRKSGWLPPTLVPLDNRNGLTLAVPYYWNIAPNRDATLIPTVMTRRGLALDSEVRYLEDRHKGRLRLNWLPQDRVTGTSRQAWDVDTEGRLFAGLDYSAHFRQVSDDDYWKDFPRSMPSSTVPRLLTQDFSAQRELGTRLGPLTAYARLQHWQVLQTGSGSELITSPYQRSPQLGLRW
jgi:LPS-assembly protein